MVCRLSEIEAADYDCVRYVLQKRFNLKEDDYRQRLRPCADKEGENTRLFIRLRINLEQWIKLTEAQVRNVGPICVYLYLREKKLADFDEVARSAELFLATIRRQLSEREKSRCYQCAINPPSFHNEEEFICRICRKSVHTAHSCRNKVNDKSSRVKKILSLLRVNSPKKWLSQAEVC